MLSSNAVTHDYCNRLFWALNGHNQNNIARFAIHKIKANSKQFTNETSKKNKLHAQMSHLSEVGNENLNMIKKAQENKFDHSTTMSRVWQRSQYPVKVLCNKIWKHMQQVRWEGYEYDSYNTATVNPNIIVWFLTTGDWKSFIWLTKMQRRRVQLHHQSPTLKICSQNTVQLTKFELMTTMPISERFASL